MFELAAGSGRSPYSIAGAEPVARRRSHGTRLVAMAMRPIFVVVGLALTMLGFALGTPNAHADQTNIDAKIGPSLVYINTVYSAWVLFPAGVLDDDSHWVGPVTIGGTCSGVVVDPSGYIATDGHCVDNTSLEIKAMAVTAAIRGDGQNFKGLAPHMSAADLRRFVNMALQQEWPIEGSDPGSPPDRQVSVIQPYGPGRVITDWTTVQVIDFQKPDNEDHALLKVSNVPTLTALPVADQVPPPGTAITSAGFPGDVGTSMDQSRRQPPSFKEGSVSSKQVQPNGAARTEVSSAQTNGMSGGPVINNATGEVIGLCDYGVVNNETGDREGGINFITDATALHSFLLKNGVHLVAPAAPAKPFPWVWIAVGGAAVVVLLALPGGLLVVRHRAKRRSAPPIDGSQLLQQAQSGQPAPQQSVGSPQPLPAYQQSSTGTSEPPRHERSDVPATTPPLLTPSTDGAVGIK